MKKSIFAAALAAAAVTAAGAEAAQLQVGDYVSLGSYMGEPIIWRCVDIDENGPLLLSDRILTLKAFDAAGYTAYGSHTRYQSRRSSGSNYWGDSNLRSWLNSEAEAGRVEWDDKNPPVKSGIVDGYNEYRQEAGFLNGFNAAELEAVREVRQKSIAADAEYEEGVYEFGDELLIWKAEVDNIVQNYDRAYGEYVSDRIFLPDVKQLNAVYRNGGTLGEDYYIGEPTAKCVESSDYQSEGFAEGGKWTYWLRTPYTLRVESVTLDKGCLSRYVTADGTTANYSANMGSCGVRPAFYPDESKLISGDGSYYSPYLAEEKKPVTILLNGAVIETDQPPININGRIMAPLRAIFEALGYTVDWDAQTYTADARRGNDVISVQIGRGDIAYRTGINAGTYECDIPPQIVSDRTLVPVRAVSECVGCEVDWNGEEQTVIITAAE